MYTRLLSALLLLLPAAVRAQEGQEPSTPQSREQGRAGQGTAPEDEALDVLMLSLDVPEAAYAGELSVVTRHGKEERDRTVLVRFAPPDRYRRQVVDERGFPVRTIVSDGETEWVYDHAKRIAWKGEPADPDYKLRDPDEEYRILIENYAFRLAGHATVAHRRCSVLEVRARGEDRLVRRLCVEPDYGVVLRRETFGPDGAATSELSFRRLALPARTDDWDFGFEPPAGARVVRNRIEPDYLELEEAANATDMRPQMPDWLPPGYVFESVNLLPYHGATLLHYRYSDGIDVLSLFQCPERTHLQLGAAEDSALETRVGGRPARLALLPDNKVLEWTSGDHFVLVGRLNADVLRLVAESVPEGG